MVETPLTEDGGTMTERAVELLQRGILSGELAPGQRLNVMDLVALYGIGATPIREALSRLLSHNLITANGRRGFRVREMSRTDLADITHVRFVIEREGILMAMQRGDDAWEASIVGHLHRLRLFVERAGSAFGEGGEEFDALHHRFHASLLSGCGSPRIIALAENLYFQAYRYRRISMRQLADPDHFIAIHETLAEAVLARDEARAAGLLQVHLESTLRTVYAGELSAAPGSDDAN